MLIVPSLKKYVLPLFYIQSDYDYGIKVVKPQSKSDNQWRYFPASDEMQDLIEVKIVS